MIIFDTDVELLENRLKLIILVRRIFINLSWYDITNIDISLYEIYNYSSNVHNYLGATHFYQLELVRHYRHRYNTL